MTQRIHLTNSTDNDIMIYLRDYNDLLGKIEPEGQTILEIEVKSGFLLSVIQCEDGFILTDTPDIH